MPAAAGTKQSYKRGPAFERLEYSNLGQLVANAGLTDIAILASASGLGRICCTVKANVAAFTAFSIMGLVTSSAASYITLASTTADFTTTIKQPLIAASGDLTLLGIGATGWFILDCRGFDTIKLQANSGAAGGTADIYIGGAS